MDCFIKRVGKLEPFDWITRREVKSIVDFSKIFWHDIFVL